MEDRNKESFYDQIRKALHYRWDPIGVACYSDEMGEYDGYIPALCGLLEKGVNQQQIFEYLWMIETNTMGLEGDKKATEEFSIWLCELAKL